MKIFDSSPIIAILGNLGKPDLLNAFESLGYSLLVPTRVVEEITGEPEKASLHKMLREKDIKQLEVINEDEVNRFRDRYPKLGKGESELILLATRFKSEGKQFCCIIDDSTARKTASDLGLRCKGTIGLLKKLNDEGILDRKVLESYYEILNKHGFRYNFRS